MPTPTAKTSNRLLWAAQIFAAILFLFAGVMKFIMPVDKMQQGPLIFPLAFLYFIGLCECLGAFGLILPAALRHRTYLTPLAAAGLTVIMAGAALLSMLAISVAAGIFPAVVGLVTAWVAYGRTHVVPVESVDRSSALSLA